MSAINPATEEKLSAIPEIGILPSPLAEYVLKNTPTGVIPSSPPKTLDQ
ncbi:MAG: hypothetical protein WC846_00285 [Candidatus Gracilibacteria bacterium]